jgi:hypothetical protein
MLDWTDAAAYQFTNSLSAGQWAWEFLRRNPRYRAEWSEFISTWRALEAAYGKPAARDVSAWQQDPRAWVMADECQASDCRVAGDKVLIECAMGARWGFYKFPPDPQDDDPVGQGRLVWREQKTQVELLDADTLANELNPSTALVCFDLSLPLADQLLSAKRRLQVEQRRRIQAGLLLAPRLAAHLDNLVRKLRLLDAMESGAESALIEQRLYAGLNIGLKHETSQAISLRDRDYRRLLLFE